MKQLTLPLLFTLTIFLLVVLFLSPFLVPILVAGLFALGLEPLLKPYHLKWKISRNRFSALILGGIVIVIYLPLGLLLGRTVVHLSKFESRESIRVSALQASAVAKDFLIRSLQKVNDVIGIEETDASVGLQLEKFEQSLFTLAGRAAESVGGWVTELPLIAASFLVFLAFLFFFLSRAPSIKLALLKLQLFPEADVDGMIGLLQDSCKASVTSAFIVGLAQASLATFGVIVIGFGDPWLVFPLGFLASFIPVIGVGPIALSLALGALASGYQGKALALLILAIIVGTTDNLIRTYLLSGKEASLHPILGLLIIIGSVVFMGLPGLFVGPVVAHLAAHLYEKFISSDETASVS